jgi:hypothetical protein
MRTFGLLLLLVAAPAARADLFDDMTNKDIMRIMSTDAAKPMAEVTANQLSTAHGLVPQSNAAILLMRTKDGRFAKLQVLSGLQNVGGIKHPVLFIEKYVTYKEGEERATVAKGGAINLYAGLQFNADLGQVATPVIGGDLEMTPAEVLSKMTVRPVSPAKLYLLTKKPIMAAMPAATTAFSEPFEPRYFNGTYKLYDDGRRSGNLTLSVDESTGEVTGTFYSDKDGQKYDVKGKVGAVRHQISFVIKYPQSAGEYSGHMFTGDGKAIAGTSKLRDRDTAFYAVRVEGGP